MTHLPALIQDLGVILMIAALVTLIFKRLRQPVVLGYLIAGLLVGPHVPMIPGVSDTASIQVWAEMGVIFLLFGLGLEFSFKKLAEVGRSATVIAVFEVLFMLGVGYFAGQLLSWSKMDSLFLGGILAISSTTIIVRAFDELKSRGKRFVSVVFGVLIVEDLAAILLLVILSTVAATQALAGWELLQTVTKLGFFLVLWFVLGIYLLPVFMASIREGLSDETALIVSLGLCLMMVIVATQIGFSPALGAFVMGSLLAETREGHRIERVLMPVKDLFAAIFFVSVGMLLDPRVLWDYSGVILLITVITIGGKFLSSSLGALMSGEKLKTSVQTGMSLAQIGEFSFIIATLGLTLKVTSDFLYPIAVAVSAITTFTTPYMIRSSESFYFWLERRLPDTLLQRLSQYSGAINKGGSGPGAFGLLLRAYGLKIILNSVIVIALTLAARRYLANPLLDQFGHLPLIDELLGLGVIFLALPFFWAILLGRPSSALTANAEARARLSSLQLGTIMIRSFVTLFLVGFIIDLFASSELSGAVMIGISGTLAIFFFRYAEPLYKKIENRFLDHLNDSEREQVLQETRRPRLTPWDATLGQFVVSPDSDLVLKSLMQSALKEKYGVTVALIERGHHQLLAPGRDELLLPSDKVSVVGPEERLEELRAVFEKVLPDEDAAPARLKLLHTQLKPESPLIGKTIRDSGLREKVQGLIVGVERDGIRIMSPNSDMSLQAHDEIWVVANPDLFDEAFGTA